MDDVIDSYCNIIIRKSIIITIIIVKSTIITVIITKLIIITLIFITVTIIKLIIITLRIIINAIQFFSLSEYLVMAVTSVLVLMRRF